MKYIFLGIGGISMSALALLLKQDGQKVVGYDSTPSELTKRLEGQGIRIYYNEILTPLNHADIIVVSSAIKEDDKVLLYAKSLHKKIMTRGELLGQISKDYKNVIAISGAHGKTTTTALISSIFIAAGLNPTVHIGGLLCEQNSNVIAGTKDFFITEACEYKDNFLYLNPTLSVVLNVEAEHLDYFKTFENVQKSFLQFIKQSKNTIAPPPYSKEESYFSFKNYKEDISGLKFDCYYNDSFFIKIKCNLHGLHNVKNILTAIEVANFFGVRKKDIQKGIAYFKGVKRRFEKHRFYNGSTLIFDYAHHPTEIERVLATVKSICKGRLYVIFQPHTYSRTKLFFSDFVNCFKRADEVMIFKTYPAREPYDENGDAKRLYEVLSSFTRVSYSEDYNILTSFGDLKENDVVLVLGAGDFYDKCKF